uniref:MATH domain-containing protein n=1 Tax=Steinernema glaseri TaxID=37863 RepID=A0A1I7XYT6_9BILA
MLLAYKFQALPLASRVNCKEFTGTQFLLRNYTDVGWAKRFTVSTAQLYDRNIDHCFAFKTRSSTFPQHSWNWIMKFSIQTYPNAMEEIRVSLMTEDIDQPRSVEFLLAVVDEKKRDATIFLAFQKEQGSRSKGYCIMKQLVSRPLSHAIILGGYEVLVKPQR